MMCRVIAPLAAIFSRDAASRLPLPRRLRTARRRALRWFHVPIAVTERERRDRDPGPSLWSCALTPGPAAIRLPDALAGGPTARVLH